MSDAHDERPKCDKCGAPITTGSMAVFCLFARECAFVEDDDQWQSIEEFRTCFGIEREPLPAGVVLPPAPLCNCGQFNVFNPHSAPEQAANLCSICNLPLGYTPARGVRATPGGQPK